MVPLSNQKTNIMPRQLTERAKDCILKEYIAYMEKHNLIFERRIESQKIGQRWRKSDGEENKWIRWYAPGTSFNFPIYEEPPTVYPKRKYNAVRVEKRKYPREDGELVALKLIAVLHRYCERIEVTGSIRREKDEVGDVELLYVPKNLLEKRPDGQLIAIPEIDAVLEQLIAEGVIAKRLSSNGRTTYGEHNKLIVHIDSGMPVDLFATTHQCWYNALVCRTGGKETNKRLAESALRLRRQWHTYSGVTLETGEKVFPESEEEVFQLCGVPYLPPEERE